MNSLDPDLGLTGVGQKQSDTASHPTSSAPVIDGNLGVHDVSYGLAHASPLVADDADVIEDSWVEAVKQIIDTNRADPYNLSKAMTLLKLEYMKKRYNKDIKVSE